MATFIKNNTTVLYHSNLQNLDYASSGHTGFASSADLSSLTGTVTSHVASTSNPHSTSFLSLSDTPSSYAGQDGLVPVVNESGGALAFINPFTFDIVVTGYFDFQAGFQVSGGGVAMGATKITGLADPTLAQDAATKTYVDTEVASAATATASLVHKGSSAPAGDETIWVDTTNDPTSWDIKILGPSGDWTYFLETT